MKWMLMPLRRYADFQGRSRRMEYWMWVVLNSLVIAALFIPIIILAISAIDRVDDRGGVYSSSGSYSSRYDDYDSRDRGTYDDRDSGYDRDRGRGRDRYRGGYSSSIEVDPVMFAEEFGPVGWVLACLMGLWILGTFIPNLAVSIRRLHDQDQSGWMILIGLIPGIGGIVLMVFYFLDGTRGPNRFGPDPKGPRVNETFA